MATDTFLDWLWRNPTVQAVATYPKPCWKTPDGRAWAPQDALRGWRSHATDRWGCSIIAQWIEQKLVEVMHVDLPSPLRYHAPDDPAWRYVAALGVAGEREACNSWGRSDLVVTFADGATADVEFGTCSPAKFALNLGNAANDQIVVPYGCRYAFAFRPAHELLSRFQVMPEVEDVAVAS